MENRRVRRAWAIQHNGRIEPGYVAESKRKAELLCERFWMPETEVVPVVIVPLSFWLELNHQCDGCGVLGEGNER
jgi:hypothetical protein